MRIAIIDLGTNTFNLLVADITDKDHFKSVFSTKVAVKLGEGGIVKKVISPAAFQRGINALLTHRAIIAKLNVAKTIAFATSAIRSSSNGKQFVEAAKKQAGIDITVISGEKEAELIFKGVNLALDIGTEPSLILDIGGGSNEFIIGVKDNMLWKQSFDIGVARMLGEFMPSDPITPEEITRIQDHLRKVLHPLFEAVKKYPVKELIGSSGSFDTFTEMIAYRFYDINMLKGKTEFVFDMGQYQQIHEQLIRSDRKEREATKGIIELRLDMIVIAAITVRFILDELNIKAMRMSTYALKQGVLAEVMQRF
jgi:exopolyphosphatase / guanosine-5'-triphosphate,3'-diphosphate pyrophosphatase